MGRIFIIMGKSATGKDTVFHKLLHECPELDRVVLYTTRPIREGEINGKEYIFCSQEEMHRLKDENKIIECRKYDTVHGPWYYFTANDGKIDLVRKDYLMISTLEGYEQIRNYFGKERIMPIYIAVDDFERIKRSMTREKKQKNPCAAEICRRFLADEKDFSEEKIQAAGINTIYRNDNLKVCVNEIIKLIKNAR